MENTKIIYLDVRTEGEWNEEHVKGALHFSLDRLEAGEFPDIPKDSDVQVYCRSGGRAGIAKEILENAGFSNVSNAGSLELMRIKGLSIE